MQSKFKSIKIGFLFIESKFNEPMIFKLFHSRCIDQSVALIKKVQLQFCKWCFEFCFHCRHNACTNFTHRNIAKPGKHGQFKAEYIPRRYIAICRFASRASAFTIDRPRFLADITSEWSFPRQDTEIQGFPCPRAAILSTHNSAMAAALPKAGRKQDRKIRVDRFLPRTVNASCSFLEPSILADCGLLSGGIVV